MLRTVSGAPVSKLAYGCMQWGGTADQTAANAMFDACVDAGITHFDTANGYTNGQSETMLGTLAKQNRDRLFIASKVGYVGGCSRAILTQQFDVTRQRLDMDQIDLLYLHRFDDSTPLEETFETMARFQSDGLIRHIGVSNYAAWQVVKANSVAKSLDTKIDAIQPMYNLVKRQAEVEIFPMSVDQDISIFPYSPLGGGLLTGKYAAQGTGRLATDERYAARYGADWMHETATAFAAFAKNRGVDPATLAVAWAARHQSGLMPIISARSLAQLEPSLNALEFDLSDADYAEISALSKTPAPATDRLEEV